MKLFTYFITLMLLISIGLMFIPGNSLGAETSYINVDFEDGTNGPYNENWGTNFAIQDDGTGNRYLHDIKSSVGINYQVADLGRAIANSFDVSFDFKIDSVVSTYYLFGVSGSATSIVSNTVVFASVKDNGSLTINGYYTGDDVIDGNWHNLYINVTYGNHAWISLDGESPWSGEYVGSASGQRYVHMGSYGSGANGECYWDNIVVATRIGSLPIASFDYTPSDGNGLTNFIFTDTSTIDNTIFPISYNWTFGDGNYTLTKNSNHTYIHAGTYQVILEVSNRFGSSYAYTNITVTAINIGVGGEEITDDMFGFVIVILLITGMNILGTKTGYLMLSIFAILGMIVAIPMLWQNDPLYIALMIVMTLGNIAILIYGLTRE